MDGIMTNKLFATRQGTILLGVIAAVIAAIALIVYLNHYRNSVNSNAESPVLVTKTSILQGTPGSVVKRTQVYTVSHVAKSALQQDAFVDPSELDGKVALRDIGQGQQLTAADFGPATGALNEQLTPSERAVVIPLGSPQSVGGQIGAGSHVDVWMSITKGSGAAAKPVVAQLLPDVYVLGVNGGNVTLRTSPQQAGQLIYGSQNAQLWLVLRPTVATSQSPRPVAGLKAGG